MSNPGSSTVYGGVGSLAGFQRDEILFNQDITSLLSSVTVNPPITVSSGSPGVITMLTDGTPVNSVYTHLNVASTGVVSNYDTVLSAFINTNSDDIKAANYTNKLFIAYNNTTTTSYTNVFPHLEVVYGFLGISAGSFSNANVTGNLNPTPGNVPSNLGANSITIDDFPSLREVVGDIVIVTDFMSSIPKFINLERCNSITIYTNNPSNAQLLSIGLTHFPRLVSVQKFLIIRDLPKCTSVIGFRSLLTVGSLYDPIANPSNASLPLTYLSAGIQTYNQYATDYNDNGTYDCNGIYIMNNGGTGPGLAGLIGFNSLQVVNGHIEISDNTFNVVGQNNFIFGFSNLLFCQGVVIGRQSLPNINLHQIIGFNMLQTASTIIINDTLIPTLYRIIAFRSLEHVNSDILIGQSNPTSKLVLLDAFKNMKSVDTVFITANKGSGVLYMSQLNLVANSTQLVTYA